MELKRPWFRFLRPVIAAALALGMHQVAVTEGAETNRVWGSESTNRPTWLDVAVLPFNNASGDPSLKHWSDAFANLLDGQLALVRGVQQVDWMELGSALTNAGWSPDRPVGAKTVELVARESGADLALWGEYTRPVGQWRLRIQLKWKGQKTQPEAIELSAASVNQLLTEAGPALAKALRRPLEREQAEKLRRLREASETALDQCAQVISLERRGASAADRETLLRRILAGEPRFVAARGMLAKLLVDGGRTAEAEAETRVLLDEAPEFCGSHLLMAWVLLKPDQWQEAEKELRAALRSHPGCPFACQILAVGLTASGRTQELREVLEAANRDCPNEASTLALLAYARARCGEVAGAGEILDQLEPIREPGWRLHEMLLETASTCSRWFLCSRELRWIRDHALASAELRQVLGEVNAGFSCSLKQDPKAFLPGARPRAYSPEALKAELERRLTPEERALVVNPVEITPEIAALAKELTAGVTNQILRALLIFGEVAERGHGGGSGGARTAPQALADAKDPQTRFSCQEYARLFVALARAAGLEAYLVHVDTLVDGSVAWHDCAALFLANSSFLVDPTLRLFGFQHRDFRVLDDLQAIAHQAMQGNPSQALPRTRMGLKLDPDAAWTRLRFVEGLTEAGLTAEAETELARLPANCTSRWDFHIASAHILSSRARWQPALAALQQALSLSPSNPVVHMELAQVYNQLADYGSARQHAEAAAQLDRGNSFNYNSKESRFQLSILGALEQATSRRSETREALQERAEAGDAAAQFALATMLAEASPANQAESLRWMLEAAKQGNDQVQRIYAQGLLAIRGKAAGPEAVQWLTRSAEQGNADAQYRLGLILYEGKLVPANLVTAGQWVQLAADSGHKEAGSLLKEMTIFLDQSQLAEARKRAREFTSKASGNSKAGPSQ